MGTYTLSSQKKHVNSGDAKLSAYRDKTSSSSSTSKPKIREQTESERKANMLISDSVDRAQGIDRSKEALAKTNGSSPSKSSFKILSQNEANQMNSVPSPVKDVESWKKSQSENNTTPLSDPHSLGSDPTEAVSIAAKPRTDVRQISEDVYLSERTTPLEEEFIIAAESTIQKNQLTDDDVTVSKPSRDLVDIGQNINTNLRVRADEIDEADTGDVPAIAPKFFRTIGGLTEMVSRVPAGAEVFVQKPSLLPAAVSVAALGTAGYIVDTAKKDPLQLGVDLVVFESLAAGVGEAGSAIKSKLPAIKTGEQGFLLKLKVPESTGTMESNIKPTIQAEYQGTAFGTDVFDIQKLNYELAEYKPTTAGNNILVGETKNGMTDVYVRLNNEQASSLSRQYSGNVRNINTPEGSFVEFEPTGLIENTGYSKSGSSQLTGYTPEMIGNVPEIGSSFSNPFRIEKRVNLQKGEMKISNSNTLSLPESTVTLDAKGTHVSDFNMYDNYKQPGFEEPLQLESGITVLEAPRKSFLASEEATLAPRRQYTEYREPSFIGEMSEMQTRYVRAKQELTFKEPTAGKSDLSQIQKLFDEAAARGHDPNPTPGRFTKVSVERFTEPQGNSIPFIAAMPDIAPRSSPFPESSFPDPMNIPGIDPTPSPSPYPYPGTSRSRSRKAPSPSIPDTKALDIGVIAGIPELTLVPKKESIERKRKSKRKYSSRSSTWDYMRSPNDFTNPFDVDIGGLF